jgi:hypothetical protein
MIPGKWKVFSVPPPPPPLSALSMEEISGWAASKLGTQSENTSYKRSKGTIG